MTLGNFADQPYVELCLIDKALVVICLHLVPTLTVFVWCQIRSLATAYEQSHTDLYCIGRQVLETLMLCAV